MEKQWNVVGSECEVNLQQSLAFEVDNHTLLHKFDVAIVLAARSVGCILIDLRGGLLGLGVHTFCHASYTTQQKFYLCRTIIWSRKRCDGLSLASLGAGQSLYLMKPIIWQAPMPSWCLGLEDMSPGVLQSYAYTWIRWKWIHIFTCMPQSALTRWNFWWTPKERLWSPSFFFQLCLVSHEFFCEYLLFTANLMLFVESPLRVGIVYQHANLGRVEWNCIGPGLI